MLSDSEVKKLYSQGLIITENSDEWQAVSLEGCVGEQFYTIKSAPGHDIVLDKFRKEKGEFWKDFLKEVSFGDDAQYTLKSQGFVLAYTKQKFKIPKELDVCCFVQGKSSYARLGLGVHVTAPLIHPGFGGGEKGPQPIMLEIYNHSQNALIIKPGDNICQYYFQSISGKTESQGMKNFGGHQPAGAEA